MKIERSEEVQAQLLEARALRKKLIATLTSALSGEAGKIGLDEEESKNIVLHTIELSAEGFRPVLMPVTIAALNRTSSMLAGPFFTSAEYPIPSNSGGMLLPIVQLDLREIGELSGQDLGDGLLQLWCDPDWTNSDRGLVVVIPREDLEKQEMTPFDYELQPGAEESPIPIELVFDPDLTEVRTITGYESTGLHCQSLEFRYDYLPEGLVDEIEDDIQRFMDLTDLPSELHVLGSFYPIQYGAADNGWTCLIHFPTWGSSGNAQLFYILHEPDMIAFNFMESLR